MIVGLAGALAANAAAFLGANELVCRLRIGRGPAAVVAFLLFRLALISTAVLVAGMGGFLTPMGLGLAGAAGLALLLASGAGRRLTWPVLPEAGRFLWILAALAGVRLLVQVFLFSPHLGDALAYHLPKIGEWIRAGGFTREMGLHPHVTFPAGFELLEAWWVVFFRHDVLIELAGVEFVLLGFAGVFALGRSFELPEKDAFCAALLYALTPGFHLSATSCLNDAAVAALVTATFALVAARAPVPILLLAAGLGLGVKATYAYALPGVVLLAGLSRRDPKPAALPRAGSSLLLLMAGFVGGFWFVRNLVWFGNPVFPVGSPGYGATAVAVQAGPRLASLLGNLRDLIEVRIYDNQAAYGANVDHHSGWGPAAFACGLVALLLAIREDARWRRLASAYAASLASCCLLMVHDPWSLKYVFFFPALLCLAAVRTAGALPQTAIILRAALVISFLGTMLPYDLPLADLRALARQPWEDRTALLRRGPLPPDGRIACFGGFRANSYLLYGPRFSRDVVYLRSATAAELLGDLERSGAIRLYAVPDGEAQAAALSGALATGRLIAAGGDFFALR